MANKQTLSALSPQEAACYERDMKDDLILLEEADLTTEGISKELSSRCVPPSLPEL